MQRKSKIIKLLIVIIAFFIFLIFLYQRFFWSFFVREGQLVELVLKNNLFSSRSQSVLVEIVRDDKSIKKGLSNRAQLQTTEGQKIDGMLFVFSSSKIQQFWMKDMRFDIDICWLNGHVLLACTRQATKPVLRQDDDQLSVYQSPQHADMVLETMPGFIEEEFVGAKFYKNLF
jgi:uncharacterized membrane protein (UPF0127 family)